MVEEPGSRGGSGGSSGGRGSQWQQVLQSSVSRSAFEQNEKFAGVDGQD